MSVTAPLSTEIEVHDEAIAIDPVVDGAFELTVEQLIEAPPHEHTPFVKEPVFPFVVLGTMSFVAILIVAYLLAMSV